jgi:glucose-6-phosphate isomerase
MIPGWTDADLPAPVARDGSELAGMTADPACRIPGPIYYMYRDVARSDDDRRWMASQHVRYDITRIPPGVFCNEFVKTKGHYHPVGPSGVQYPEVYEVMSGRAHYLLQRPDLTDAALIEAEAGTVVLIPPGYGHITINPDEEELVMANLVSSSFSSDYKPYETLRGGAYYELADRGFVPNPAYASVPPLRQVAPPDVLPLGIFEGSTLYDQVEERAPLDWLDSPGEYMGLLILP